MGSQGKCWGFSQFFGLTFYFVHKEVWGDCGRGHRSTHFSSLCVQDPVVGRDPEPFICAHLYLASWARARRSQPGMGGGDEQSPRQLSSLWGLGGHDFLVPSGAEGLSEMQAMWSLSCRKLGLRPSQGHKGRGALAGCCQKPLGIQVPDAALPELGPDCRGLDSSL